MSKILLWTMIIFGSGHYLSTVSQYISLLILLPIAVLVVSFVKALIQNEKVCIPHKYIIAFSLFILPVVLQSIINFSFGYSEIKYIVVLLISFFVCGTISYEEFKQQFVTVMEIICVAAIFGYMLSFTPVINLLPKLQNYNGYTYYSGIMFSGMSYAGTGFYERIQGLFWEPGLFATHIALAMYFSQKEYFKSNKRYTASMLLFLLTMILTKSAAGILLLILLPVIKFFDNRSFSSRVVILFAGIFIAILIAVKGMGMEYIDQYVLAKVMDTEHTSMIYRLRSIPIDLKIFINNPLGVGVSNYSTEVLNQELYASGTSTITVFLAEFGIFGIYHFAFWITSLLKMARQNQFMASLVAIVFFILMFTKESHETLIIANCLVLYNSFIFKNTDLQIEN